MSLVRKIIIELCGEPIFTKYYFMTSFHQEQRNISEVVEVQSSQRLTVRFAGVTTKWANYVVQFLGRPVVNVEVAIILSKK